MTRDATNVAGPGHGAGKGLPGERPAGGGPACQAAKTMDGLTLGDLFHDHSTQLIKYISRLTFNDRHLAEDIVQETLFRAWQRPEVLDTRHTTVRPWLYTVARNLLRDYWRARRARPAESDDSDLYTVSVLDTALDRVLEGQAMRQALLMLNEKHRAVLVEVYYRDQSLEEASLALGLPIGTVKSRLHHAHRALKQAMEQIGLTPTECGPIRRRAATRRVPARAQAAAA